jgi:hypothetical protein
MPKWSVPREWAGEACFILAGGPSVLTQDLSLLRGRRVIAINSAFQTYPDADFLFFGDARWWRVHCVAVKRFAGRVVTCSWIETAPVLRLNRCNPPGLSSSPDCLTMRHTSLQGAINLACHLGATLMILLGADGKIAADGRTHHHAPHPWPQVANCWAIQRADLVTVVDPLRQRGVTVLNASPGSALADLWPVVELGEAIALADRLARKAA